jgi:uncharacterized protein (DUF1800 family)
MNLSKQKEKGASHARHAALAATIASASLLAACGGGSSSSTPNATADSAATAQGSMSSAMGKKAESATATHTDAVRLLTQGTFGPTTDDINHVMSVGIGGWVDEQLAIPVRASHLARWNSDNALLAKAGGATSNTLDSSFFQEAVTSDDQLRQRVTFALSEYFVISTQDKSIGNNRTQSSASYLDMLANGAFGNFRDLLQAVTLHPAMGQYLSTMANQAEDPKTGRIPDQNYAREVMQLFSIGLVQLNIDGTPKLDANGQPIPTYQQSDIDGLSRVFTGFSWSGPDTSWQRFNNTPGYQDPNRLVNPMQPYAAYHSLSEKKFLTADIPASTNSDPMGDLKIALDTIFNHPNVGPFFSKQMIQHLVTSNPSPAYVARIARVFNNDGNGVRGNIAAVVRAILTDNEATGGGLAAGPTYGKLREPVLRLTAYLRAYPSTSDSGGWLIGTTDDPGLQLSQSAMRARSVFNFWRPGYIPPGARS